MTEARWAHWCYRNVFDQGKTVLGLLPGLPPVSIH